MDNLRNVLKESGQQPVDLGGKALILPHGGRVLGLYPRDDNFGDFGEIEYHSPALGATGQNVVHDENSVWAVAGPADVLQEMVNQLVRI